MATRGSGLWLHTDFLKLWVGQTVSALGSAFTGLALPFVAIYNLHATPAQLGVLTASVGLPWLVLGPFVGVIVDRLPRRSLLIGADLGRAALLASVPVANISGILHIEFLYFVAFFAGALTACFETAYQSYLPALVEVEQIIEGNSKLSVTGNISGIVGPSLAGTVIQAVSAAAAMAIDALSFLFSAFCLLIIGKREAAPTSGGRLDFRAALREGIAFIGRQPILRAFAGANATFMLFIGMMQAVLLLFLSERLHFSPGVIGVVFSTQSVGGLIGALAARPVSQHLGPGPAIIGASALRGVGVVCLPLATLIPIGAVPLVIAGQLTQNFGWSIWSVAQVSVRQAVVPDRLRGRVTAGFLLLVRATPPLGALAGGLLGEKIGLTPVLAIAATGVILSTGWLLASPLWHLREQPAPVDEFAQAATR
jgi:MFS family permease